MVFDRRRHGVDPLRRLRRRGDGDADFRRVRVDREGRGLARNPRGAAGGVDGFADGKARTFIPFLPRFRPRVQEPVPVAIVLPLRGPVWYAADGRLAVAVLFRSGATLVQRYGAAESGPGVWSAVTVQVGDFHFDDAAEVWIGYRYDGTGQYLDFDVLDPRPDGSVFLGGLQGLDHGVVRVHPGGASVQSAVYAASDPGCCPSTMLQREVTFSADQWWIDAGASYPAAATPPLTGNL